MLNRNTKRGCVLLTTCAAALISTGCRSMPGTTMFGMRGEPSAEALAGSGPTTTYPAPPSASATPEAIASIAGGTAAPSPAPAAEGSSSPTAQVAGFDVSPGYATPAANTSTTNMAAAQANGIYGGIKSRDFGAPAAPKTTLAGAKPSGYSFGSNAATAKPKSPPASYLSEPPSAYAKATSKTPAAGSVSTTAANSFAPPPTSSYTTPPPASSSGYTLPTDSPAVAAITPPQPSGAEPADAKPAAPPEADSATSFALPAAAAPDFSTASMASPVAPSPSVTDDATKGSSGGYSPGSTGAAVGYPSGIETPTTSGSFYR